MKKSVFQNAVLRLVFALALSLVAIPAFAQPAGQPAKTEPAKPAPAKPAPAAAAQPAAPAESLYKRLGGYDAIAGVVDDFLSRLAGDPSLGRFFTGLSNDSRRKVRQNIVDQLCEATGGPCYYVGRSMKTVHAGLGITEADWTGTVTLLGQTFDKFKVGQKERDEVLAALTALKPDIVTAK